MTATGNGPRTMIETTLGAIVAAEPALDRLGARPLPAKVAYTTAKLLKLVRAELQEYRTLHDELVRKYGEEDRTGSGEIFRVKPDAWPAFRQAMTEVLASAVVIPWEPLTLSTLGDDPWRADDLAALGPFIVDGAPAPAAASTPPAMPAPKP